MGLQFCYIDKHRWHVQAFSSLFPNLCGFNLILNILYWFYVVQDRWLFRYQKQQITSFNLMQQFGQRELPITTLLLCTLSAKTLLHFDFCSTFTSHTDRECFHESLFDTLSPNELIAFKMRYLMVIIRDFNVSYLCLWLAEANTDSGPDSYF